MNFRSGVKASYIDGSFTDKGVDGIKAFQIGYTVIDTHDIETFKLIRQALFEGTPIFLLRFAPT